MRRRLLEVLGVVGVILAVIVLLKVAPAGSASPSLDAQDGVGRTGPAGHLDRRYQTPLQRPASLRTRNSSPTRSAPNSTSSARRSCGETSASERGTEHDVAGAYNAVFQSIKHTGRRTSLIVDPPDGRIPPLTPEATEASRPADREFRLALLQATETCKNKRRRLRRREVRTAVADGQRNCLRSTTRDALNRSDGPEDRSMRERCMAAVLPDFGGYRRIVQSPGSRVDLLRRGPGPGLAAHHRPWTAGPASSATVRQWFGDSRGRWEGNTLVVDVTNFSPKSDFQGARENLHLVERWTRVDANTLEYTVTIEDPTTWTQAVDRQAGDDQAGRAGEPDLLRAAMSRGNYGLPALLLGHAR